MRSNSNFTAAASGSDSSKVANMKWYLGGPGSSWGIYSTINYYTAERNGTVYSGNPTTATGTIGLMYASDYGFTFKDVDSTCYNTPNKCYTSLGGTPTKSWMFPSSHSSWFEWTLTPSSDSSSNVNVVSKDGEMNNGYAYNGAIFTHEVRPVVYLKSDIQISGGTGQKGDPYTLSDDSPTCTLNSISPTNLTSSYSPTVVIDCKDTSGTITKDLTGENLQFVLEDRCNTYTRTTTNNLIKTENITNGKRYTFQISSFDAYGQGTPKLFIKIAENSVMNSNGKGNTETILNTSNLTTYISNYAQEKPAPC